MDPVVIIGFGMGAIGAVKSILRSSRKHEIILIEQRDFETYSPCGMPSVVEGAVPEHDMLKHAFPDNRRLTKMLNTEAIALNVRKKKVRIRNTETQEENEISYSNLLLDTGARPIIPAIPFEKNLLNNGIYTFSRPQDVDLILKAVPDMEKVAVVGAGATGIEVSQALHAQGIEVMLVERMSHPFPGLFDSYMGKMAARALPAGIIQRFNTHLKSIIGTEKVEAVHIGDEKKSVDAVVLCLGVEPRLELAHFAGLKVNTLGIVVDEHMRTSNTNIYAVGDCIQSWNRITGFPMRSRLAPPALQQGTVAGENIVGNKKSYTGSLSSFVTLIGGTEFATIGLSDSALQASVSVRIKVKNKPDFMEPEDITLKLISGCDGKILGARIIGYNASTLINRVSLAIDSGITIYKLAECEFAYCPPINDVFDPIITAAETLVKKLDRHLEKNQGECGKNN